VAEPLALPRNAVLCPIQKGGRDAPAHVLLTLHSQRWLCNVMLCCTPFTKKKDGRDGRTGILGHTLLTLQSQRRLCNVTHNLARDVLDILSAHDTQLSRFSRFISINAKTVNLITYYRPEYKYCVPLTTQKEPRTLLLLKTAYVLGTRYFNVSRITGYRSTYRSARANTHVALALRLPADDQC
jgi:hypothetical protein